MAKINAAFSTAPGGWPKYSSANSAASMSSCGAHSQRKSMSNSSARACACSRSSAGAGLSKWNRTLDVLILLRRPVADSTCMEASACENTFSALKLPLSSYRTYIEKDGKERCRAVSGLGVIGRQDEVQNVRHPALKVGYAVIATVKNASLAAGIPVGHVAPVQHFVALAGQQVIAFGPCRLAGGQFGQFVKVFRPELEAVIRMVKRMEIGRASCREWM